MFCFRSFLQSLTGWLLIVMLNGIKQQNGSGRKMTMMHEYWSCTDAHHIQTPAWCALSLGMLHVSHRQKTTGERSIIMKCVVVTVMSHASRTLSSSGVKWSGLILLRWLASVWSSHEWEGVTVQELSLTIILEKKATGKLENLYGIKVCKENMVNTAPLMAGYLGLPSSGRLAELLGEPKPAVILEAFYTDRMRGFDIPEATHSTNWTAKTLWGTLDAPGVTFTRLLTKPGLTLPQLPPLHVPFPPHLPSSVSHLLSSPPHQPSTPLPQQHIRLHINIQFVVIKIRIWMDFKLLKRSGKVGAFGQKSNFRIWIFLCFDITQLWQSFPTFRWRRA